MRFIEILPTVIWADDVPCQMSLGRYVPKKALPVPLEPDEGVGVCFLNEARTRYGSYEVPHHNMTKYHDDGPPSLDQIVEACRIIEEELKLRKKVMVYAPKGVRGHSNFSALCVAAHLVLARGYSAREAAKPWLANGKTGVEFYMYSWAPKSRPAPPRTVTMEHCLQALQAARDNGWVALNTFDTDSFLDDRHAYDAAWLIPGKLQVMADPMCTVSCADADTVNLITPNTPDWDDERPVQSERSFTGYFKENNIGLVVRNNFTSEEGLPESYDPEVIKRNGISFLDVGFADKDGAVPHQSVIARVIRTCEKVGDKAIAFHCKSGFGRSILCASTWISYHYDLPGVVTLAWARICRPGAITSPQQAIHLMRLKGKQSIEAAATSAGCGCTIS